MKKLILLSLLGISSIFAYDGYYAPYEGTTCINQGWEGGYSHGLITDSSSPYTLGEKLAYALDIKAYKRNILAVKDGEVVKTGYHSGFGYYVVIKHNDGLYSQYTHLNKIKVQKGTVHRGTVIGISGNTGSYASGAWHLHFQFSTVERLITDMAHSKKVNFQGFSINSVKDINHVPCTNSQKRTSKNVIYTGSNNSEDNLNTTIIDGAGSLVSSTENIAGGNHDYALMHPHSSSKSTVVFQWLYDVDSCSHIDLFAYPNALDVTVQAKRWDGHLVKEMFNVTLNAYNKNNLNSSDKDLSNGISLEKVDNSCSNDSNCDWTTLAVTSQKPLKSNEYIIAHCRDNSSAIKRGNRQDITPELVSLDNNYFWTGTGSLISKLEDRNFESAGVGKDYAATYNTKKSFTTFQWYTSDNCRKVKIQGYKESSSVVNEVAFKEWNASSWTSSKCGNSLPCTIVAPKIGNYFIIKVKSNAGAIGTEYLQAECVE